MVFSKFLNFFAIFLEISIMVRVGTQRNDFSYFFLFLDLSQPILASKEALMVFSNFLNIFAIFLEFSFTGRVGPHRNNFFYLLSFVAFPNLFWLETKL